MLDNQIEINDSVIVLKFADSKVPEFKKDRKSPFVNFGEENKYPDYLLELYNKSPKHNAIINGKQTYIFGGGLQTEDGPTKAWLSRFNGGGENGDDVAQKSLLDISIFGGFYWEIIFNQSGQIQDIYHTEYKNWRANEDATEFYYKRDWSDKKEEMKIRQAFNPEVPRNSVFFYSEYRPGAMHYSLPEYLACNNYIEADIEVSKHTLTNAKTGFSASKILNFFNGQPEEEGKKEIERRFNAHYTGSEGKKIIIAYNDNPDKAPQITDLGSSDLTKEDFAHVDELIAQNIFAGHQITSPALFGIQQEGKLGNHNELRNSFEIFRNTYAQKKQFQFARIINAFAGYKGLAGGISFVKTDPIGIDYSDNVIIQVAPRSWVLDKMGIDPTKYPDPPAGNKTTTDDAGATAQKQEAAPVNENLKNLTAKQYQQVERIISRYKKGKLTRDQAALLLKTSLGLSDEEVSVMLQMDPQNFRAIFTDEAPEYSEEEVADMFGEIGEVREQFDIVESRKALFGSDDEVKEFELNFFQALQFDADDSDAADPSLADSVRKRIDKIQKIEKKLPKISIKYSYEVGAGNGPAVIEGTRPFCKKMISLDRLYSRQDIESISQKLGYSVWDRRGGFWNHGKGKGSTPYCRHVWKSNVVIKKN